MSNKPVVAGVDSSTQSVKVVLCEIETGEILRTITRPHPDGTEVDPIHWLNALNEALNPFGLEISNG